ncbi:hypothetical protein TD95_004659 [Thielaviopsis punctulata]|uniref:Vacuolar membrane protein n=1 Tax=Thielaviopsis punctulata TaxID=72032 RepID=A0A0F4ZGM2_9PEZI|nr:hypothetical protein TD95_004659 [Thielaviopsis punctulata]
MACCGRSRKKPQFRAEQKWEYINLNDFKSKSCFTHIAYGYLWFSILLSTAVYAVDTLTAVNLLALNNWTSKIKPDINLNISKWVFSVCIILSFINLGYEHIRAWKVMRRGNVAECYLDSLAVKLESTRLGKRQGYRRFLVFAELTKSKKGVEYIALFTYFNLQAWVRVLLCSGPRQVINAFTIKALYVADLNPNASDVESSLVGFFENLRTLATDDYQKALILAGMCFTLLVWIFSFIFLVLAVLAYVFFLWHWIPRADGGLAGYCDRKVNKTLTKIVTKKVNKAIKAEEEKRMKEALKKSKSDIHPIDRKATLPTLPNVSSGKIDALAQMPTLPKIDFDTKPTLPNINAQPTLPKLDRKDTMASMASTQTYSSKPANSMGQRQPPTRTQTNNTVKSGYSANASLINNAQDMGYDNGGFQMRGRSNTNMSGYSMEDSYGQPNAMPSAAYYGINRPGTANSTYSNAQSAPYNGGARHPPVPANTMNYNRTQPPAPSTVGSQYPARQQTQGSYYSNNGVLAPNQQPMMRQYGDMNMARTASPSPYGQPMRQPILPNIQQSPSMYENRQPTLPNILPEPTLPNILPEPTLPNLDRAASASPFDQPSRTPSAATFGQPNNNKTFVPFNPNIATSSNGPAEGQPSVYDVFSAGDGRSSSPTSSRDSKMSNNSVPQLPNFDMGISATASTRSATALPELASETQRKQQQYAPQQPQRNMTAPIGAGYTGSGYGSDFFDDQRQLTASPAFDLEHYDVEQQGDRRR